MKASSMRLYLMRHAVAVDPAAKDCPPDPERPLTPKGAKRAKGVIAALKQLGVAPELVLSSPYLRALQTAEMLVEGLGVPRRALRRTEALLPLENPTSLLAELADLQATSVLCVGHAPNLDLVIARALGGRDPVTSIRKAGIVCLDLERRPKPHFQLVWLFEPRTLRRLAGAK